MTPIQILFTQWDFDPSVVIGCASLILFYIFVMGNLTVYRSISFCGGVISLFLALTSPLDVLSDTYLFSAHMLQHMVLIFVTPILLILGLPEKVIREALEFPVLRSLGHVLTKPWMVGMTAGVLWNAVLWVWHFPFLFNLTLKYEWLHVIEHLLFLISSVIFWWPIFSPVSEERFSGGTAVIYLAVSGFFNMGLGVFLTFVPSILYPAYLNPHDHLNVLSWLRNDLGLTPQVDQELGGLFMWLGGSFVFLIAVLSVVVRWFDEGELEYE